MRLIFGVACLALRAGVMSAEEPPVDFDRDIRPILSNTCYTCHGPDAGKREAELRLDVKESAFAPREGYSLIVPGDPAKSELIQRITSAEPDLKMPPPDQRQQLTPGDIELLKRWVAEGAKWEQHWAFVPPQRPELPAVQQQDWPANGVDWFILAKLEQAGLKPSPAAAKETLIRRVTLDLTGLPPTLAEVDEFLRDESPDAYEKVVDRLLKSPRFGEQMAVAWLDAARYADTNGYQQDGTRTLWPWRDWVVQALNDNLPFDQFTIQQLAGDLLPEPSIPQQIATGFHRNHMLNGEGGRIAEESRVEYVIDRVDTTATVWLGLTMGCARCHDHKYDPVSQNEFYQMYAFFNNIDERGGVDRGGNANPVLELPTQEQQKQAGELQQRVDELDRKFQAEKDQLNEEQKKAKEAEIKQLRDQLANLKNSYLITMVMREQSGEPRQTFRLQRGAWDNPDKSQQLFPNVPAAVGSLPADGKYSRLDLAKWLVSPEHPLTARVTVNRYWQQFFGAGLVKTTEDFGSQGERPSHPQLLDWLAAEFIRTGWDVKAMHKLLVMSATYRQSSRLTAELAEADPDNRLLSRAPRFRLSSHALRDQALAVSGLLVERLGGPPVKPYQPAGVWLDMTLGKIDYQQDHGDKLYRRSLYTFWRRSVGPTMLFDTAARQVCTVRQSRTNTPLHALTLMNDITYVEAARKLAERAIAEAGPAPAERLGYAFRLCTSRPPTPAELETLVRLLPQVLQQYEADPQAAAELLKVGESPVQSPLPAPELAAYAAVMNAILNLDETLTRE